MSDRRNRLRSIIINNELRAQLALALFLRFAQDGDSIDVLIGIFFPNETDDEITNALKFFLLTLLYGFKQVDKDKTRDIKPTDFITKVLEELTDLKQNQPYI